MQALSALRHPRLLLYERNRRAFAKEWLSGSGVEIGALHSPFPVPRAVVVRYLDHLDTPGLRLEYPELAGQPLVDVQIVDDGETLAAVADASQDFVVASHFLEHCEDPIGTLQAHLRVLRPGGVLLLAMPDRRHGVDTGRNMTPLDHLIADHEQGPEHSRAQHYREWAELVDLPLGNVTTDHVAEHAADMEQRRYSIHFHCWTSEEFGRQLDTILLRYQLPATIQDQRMNYHEFLVALRRT